jgi:hypothetical protein
MSYMEKTDETVKTVHVPRVHRGTQLKLGVNENGAFTACIET